MSRLVLLATVGLALGAPAVLAEGLPSNEDLSVAPDVAPEEAAPSLEERAAQGQLAFTRRGGLPGLTMHASVAATPVETWYDPVGLSSTGRAISGLTLDGPADVSRDAAEVILTDTGFICPRNPTYERALRALHRAYGCATASPRLDARAQQWLWVEYLNCRAALSRFSTLPDVTVAGQPELVGGWIRDAASLLTTRRVPVASRERLLRSLITSETSGVHWRSFRPEVSCVGAVGFGQFMPATAQGLGINRYDPAQNICGSARYLDQLIRWRGSVRAALAFYNGGTDAPAESYAYADRTLRRAGL